MVRQCSLLSVGLGMLCLAAWGCLRYTPSQQELAGVEELLPAEQFRHFEAVQQERLVELVSRRMAESQGSWRRYQIGVGDLLEVKVFEVEELSRRVRVRPDGKISLAVVGEIVVEGLQEMQLEEEIRGRLKEVMYDPQVQVFIAEYAAQQISVIGEVAKPGKYALRHNDYTLVELLSEAGGQTANAGGSILLIPTDLSVPEMKYKGLHGIEIYFDELVGSASKAPLIVPLRAGDTIVVPRAGTINVDGEVQRPGVFSLGSRLTVLGALAAAGGLTYSADASQVEIIRELEGGKKVLLPVDTEQLALKAGRDVRLRDGDIVRVPSGEGRFYLRQAVETLSRLFRVGVNQSIP